MRAIKYLNSAVVIAEIFLSAGGVAGFQVVFGHGEGDIYIFGALYVVTIVHIIITYRLRHATPSRFITPFVIFFFLTTLFCLKATFWRGPEYPWENGNVFYRIQTP